MALVIVRGSACFAIGDCLLDERIAVKVNLDTHPGQEIQGIFFIGPILQALEITVETPAGIVPLFINRNINARFS